MSLLVKDNVFVKINVDDNYMPLEDPNNCLYKKMQQTHSKSFFVPKIIFFSVEKNCNLALTLFHICYDDIRFWF